MKKIELLAPAGDPQKLASAIYFGADAVYLGGPGYGLRSQAGNFDLDQLRQARRLCSEHGVRLYLTLNATPRTGEWPHLQAYLEELRPLDLDAYIVADPGVLALVRQLDPRREIHLSTQANTANAAAVRFWQAAGVSRVNLARELSLDDIRAIRAGTDLELEAFVHGAMCVAWSGRCLLSAALTGRSANRGACAQPCRWSYRLEEELRPGEYHTIEEDERGTYLFNSRDLRLVEHLPVLLAAGVDSLKIEGRMKSRYYVAAVTRVYRRALDAWQADPEGWHCDPLWLEELDKVSHRPYDSGFLFAREDPVVEAGESRYRRACDFVAVVLSADPNGRALVEGRNRFRVGEQIEVIGPRMRQQTLVLERIETEDGESLSAAHANFRVWLQLPAGTAAGDLLRRPVAG
ncbi:peptidase U32 family protein [Geothermobacter hydrogeniphilus]|uniref:Peptidase U32 n=1 Tax=Geothermobacter hydrogeniphilus TaxID=1969733 RepID=A0A1X0Y3Z6_9BACT|nr:U32 family peptidase [Geothermobacter hydrogeniphilus]ORJ59807.1 peptidase U32 [Geothermobacter hydrogeniphilus]